MSPESTFVDVSQFTAVDRVSDPAAMIEMLDRLKRLLRAPKDALLDRLAVQGARVALDVGCGTGGDVLEMASRMSQGGEAVGVDASEAMITEARRRHSRQHADVGAGFSVTFRVGDALDLPYPDGAFDICRAETVLQHLRNPRQAIREMVRVTRPGGRVGALDFDHGGSMLDHPDQQATQVILNAYTDSIARGWMGRQLPRMFREAGLTEVSVDPFVIFGALQTFRGLLTPTMARLRDEHVLTDEQVNEWWAALSRWEAEGNFLGSATAFVVTGMRRP